ncbi:putative zeaxanthin epoxidase [Helianthus annuus]|nr:putative zeaxanthin epoxidase [Helianthus annuus]KAJ0928101.1 putative zeaxanthin epoxidase [Helianthus annuus]
MLSCPTSLSLSHSYCSMAYSQCLFWTCYHHLNQHVYPTINRSFKAKKTSIICANYISRKRCILKAKRSNNTEANNEKKERRVRILIAGGGVGGLVLALAAKQSGFEVMVFEKDLSAVRGEGRHRGPIQLLSSALGILVGIDKGVADQIMEAGCVTGNRVNGLADGLSGDWLAKYDLMAPASKAKLPVTIVISRMTLQEILLNAVGSHIVFNKSKVVGFSQDPHKVVVTLDDGRKFEGDILVGADGIWSEVRKKLFGSQEASYSGYTCYSGLAEHVPSYINTIGYRVFLGQNQYFVASDVGNGKMQWYAFHKEALRSIDTPEDRADKKERLMELFGCWCNDVTTLIAATREDMIFRRDIYDRDMIYSWGKGRVTLLGDAAHPMQPNLGQGGCLAIEDCRQLILELQSMKKRGFDAITLYEISSALKRYEQARMLRTKIVHVVTRVASKSLSGYKPFIYLWTLRLPHIPFKVFGFFLRIVMPYFMTWLLTGRWHSLQSVDYESARLSE